MSSNSAKKLTVLFITLDGYGHINACIGVAQQLARRGHRVVFAIERAWRGTASKYEGIEEAEIVDPTRDPNMEANEHWIKWMTEARKKFPLEPMEAIKIPMEDLEWDFLQTMLNIDDELKRVIDEVKPDVIVVDTYTVVPCVYHCDIPWVWLTSATPLTCLPDEQLLPPSHTGYPTTGPKSQWDKYREAEKVALGPLITRFCQRLAEFNVPPPTHGAMIPSPHLNIYAYPEETDYVDIRPLPPKFLRFDHFIRNEPESPFEIPDKLLQNPLGKIVYVSMGSMGCADVNLMNRLLGILAKSPNRFIISLGPLFKQFELAPNQWGAKFVPQTKVIQAVDLVITHGGNNTFIETLYYGHPMIITPLFGDQLDNAQRITEVGLGSRLSPYHSTEQEFLDTIEKLLYDEKLSARLVSISTRMQQSNATEKAAIEMEKLAL